MLVHSYIVTKYVEASILVFLISEGQLFGTLESNIFISDLKRYSRHPHESSLLFGQKKKNNHKSDFVCVNAKTQTNHEKKKSEQTESTL